MIEKSWQKLPRLSFPEIIQCLCSIGDYVYATSKSSPPEIYTLADNTRQQCRDNLRLFAQEGLDTVAAAVMNSKLYVLHGFPTSQTSSKTCLSAMFWPTTSYPHFGSSLIVVNNRLYVAGVKTEFYRGVPHGENAPVEAFKEKKRPSSWFVQFGQFAGFHSRDKQIGLPLRGRRFCYHSYDYRPNLTPLSLITIIAQKELVWLTKRARDLNCSHTMKDKSDWAAKSKANIPLSKYTSQSRRILSDWLALNLSL